MELIKGYKKTDVGVLPSEWKIKELNEISSITRLAGYEYSTMWQENPNGEIIALRGFNIGKNKIIEKEFVRISNLLSLKLKRSRLYKGNIIYPCVGTIGNAVVINENHKYHIQQNIAKITPNELEVFPLFLAYYLMSWFGLNEIKKFNGSSSQPNILVGSLRKYSIILPSLKEQTTISLALSNADALIWSLEKLIEKKKNIKQGAMQQLLTPKKDWVVYRLGEVGNCFAGGTPSTFNKSYWNGDIIWLPSGRVQNNILEKIDDEIKITKTGLEESSAKLIKKNSVLIAITGATCGNIGLLQFEATANQSVVAVEVYDKFDYLFLYYMLLNNRNVILSHQTGSAQGGVNLKTIKNLEFQYPDKKNEQYNISLILYEMDIQIISLERKLAKIKLIKQGMMQNLLTGKIRLV